MPTSAPGTTPGTTPGTAGTAGPRRKRPTSRLSADQRRVEVLEAAVVEFAEAGYHGTRTADIAARAGVSQPYVYALFPDKRSLFLACHDWTIDRIKESIEKASADSEEEDVDQILDRVYQALFDAHPHQVLFQVQAHAAATADPVIRAPVRERFIELIELSERLHDAPRDLVLRHVARAMLGNVALALDLPPEYLPAV
jgi:AcrR family transcriptional regulator